MTHERSLAGDALPQLAALEAKLAAANGAFMRAYPGERAARQPVHTLYLAGDAFDAGTIPSCSRVALAALAEHGWDGESFAKAVGVVTRGDAAARWYERVTAKLAKEPVEDIRLDFEDGYGVRADEEEDAHVVAAAEAIGAAAKQGTLPPFYGIRVKPLNEDCRARSLRTVDLFVTALVKAVPRPLLAGLRLTLAKVTVPEQVEVMAEVLAVLEAKLGLPARTLRFEAMIEVAQAVIDASGKTCVRPLVDAGQGRCFAAHLGTYDYTASVGITAQNQRMSHPACDFAKHVLQVSLAGTGVEISDGSTNVLPVAPPGARPKEVEAAIIQGWRCHRVDVRRSLDQGFYQGWDLHPLQLPSRFAAVFGFFLEALPAATRRMHGFLERVSHASDTAGVADDAATGQALLNFFLRGLACGAITEGEARETGLTDEELRGRSFPRILAGRRKSG